MRRRTVGRPSVRLNQCEITPITPYAKRPTMHDEGDDIMETINWLVAGKNSMEMHGFTNGDDGNDPTIKVLTSASGTWTFTFRDVVGTGRIQVGAGADYNPLDLIESLYHHVKSSTNVINSKSKDKVAQVKTFDVKGFDKGFKVNWE
jgi:hypothetical protein